MDPQRLGTVRRLARLTSDDGFFLVAALDHPENYLALFDKDVARVPYDVVVRSKLELAAALAPYASALLLDPVWSHAQAIATGTLPRSVGVIEALDMLRYTPDSPPGWDPDTVPRPGWTPEKAARIGADGVKLVVIYRAERGELAARQRKLVAELVAACRAVSLPLVVEPIWYPLPGEDAGDPAVARERARAIVAAAAEFAMLGPDILKVQFPGSVESVAARASAAAAAGELDAALPVPWVLLSEGAGYEDFAVQMEITARAGASGYIAGRAVWGDAVGHIPDAQRRTALARAGERLSALNEIVRGYGRPWVERIPVDAVSAALPPDWYQSYGG
jgi:tagatose-1,6-bisphosphate aldolase